MSAPEIPQVAIDAMDRDCDRCVFHGFACPRHAWAALDEGKRERAHLEHQNTVLTIALGELAGTKGGAA